MLERDLEEEAREAEEEARQAAAGQAAAVVVLSLTVEWGVGMRRQDLSYGEVVNTRFTSSGPSRWK